MEWLHRLEGTEPARACHSGLLLSLPVLTSTLVLSGCPITSSSDTPEASGASGSGTSASASASTSAAPVNPPPLTISTKTLPSGTVGQSYSAMLVPSGGTAPYTWSVVSGALPAGLVLDASSGRISGTPTAAESGASLSLQVADSSRPVEDATANIGLNILVAPADITVSLSPARAGIAKSPNNCWQLARPIAAMPRQRS